MNLSGVSDQFSIFLPHCIRYLFNYLNHFTVTLQNIIIYYLQVKWRGGAQWEVGGGGRGGAWAYVREVQENEDGSYPIVSYLKAIKSNIRRHSA